MTTILLTSGDARDAILQAKLAASGIVPDEIRSAWGCPEVCGWGIQDAPALICLHDGRAVLQLTDNDAIPKATTWKARATKAAAAYDVAKLAATPLA